MSDFDVFQDPITSDQRPASTSVPNPLNSPQDTDQDTHRCSRCLCHKDSTEFSSDEILLATQTWALQDATNEQNIDHNSTNKRRKKNGPTCMACQKQVKRDTQARRAKADKKKWQLERIPWKEVIRMIEEGFAFHYVHVY